MSEIRIGISGWTYAPWRGTFFPAGLRQKEELAFASRQIRSIEINGTFYSLQRPSSFASWYDQTPPDFLFSVKAPRFITHIKRLRDVKAPLANFFASGVLRLNKKLGPLLWQLPPSLRFDPKLLRDFFRQLPRSTREAALQSRHYDTHLRAPAWTQIDADRPLRHALEVRHRSFESPDFIELLREYDIALVVADTAGKWPYWEDVTAPFVYVRLHGDEQLYVSGYTPTALASWAKKIRAWSRGRNPARAKLLAPRTKPHGKGHDVFVYFDNDVKTRAPYDAMSLAHRLGLGPKPSEAPAAESITEEPRTSWPGFTSTRKPEVTKRPRPATKRASRNSRTVAA